MGDEAALIPSDEELLDVSRDDPSQFGVFYERHARVGWVTIPSTSPPLPTVTADGRRLLVSLIDPADPNRVADRVVVVDLTTQVAEVVYEGSRAGTAFWAGDDRTVVVISSNEQGNQAIEVVDSTTGSRTRINDALPAGYYVIAGR